MPGKEITRRSFLGATAVAGWGGFALPAKAKAGKELGCTARTEGWTSRSSRLPRKVIVGTVMQPFWVKYPGLEQRLRELTELIDRMQSQAQTRYGRGIDLGILPEMAVTGEVRPGRDALGSSFPLEGPVKETFSRKARQYHCYIVAPLYLLEDKAAGLCSNAAVLFDRNGEMAGIYRKVHLVVDQRTGSTEDGATPGKNEPVFKCDFGKLGIQICYDMEFDSGWRDLARQGAELVAWPSQSPQRSRPVSRAMEGHYYIVSSTWRNNASVFEPTGKIVAQVVERPEMRRGAGQLLENNVLALEIDLSYAIVPWSGKLENGKLVSRTYGEKAGFNYYEDDDRGIFWSNDPHTTILEMLRKLGLREQQEELRTARKRYHEAGVPGY
ncbi:MAG TPA: carbon-nitrogen hydrolase family protein [Terriglobia bacterium]|nr:carbon-nitrogen hydrolase family protein [Terriglobia bacterium]